MLKTQPEYLFQDAPVISGPAISGENLADLMPKFTGADTDNAVTFWTKFESWCSFHINRLKTHK